jgi:hypothetical protein
MTAQAQAHHVAKLEAELLSFERMLPSARDIRDAHHIRDRIASLSRDLERARSGQWVGPS